MRGRSRRSIIVVIALLAGCAGVPAAPPRTSLRTAAATRSPVVTPTASAAPSPSRTTVVASTAPSATAAIGATVNPDGSVWIRPPAQFDFGSPGEGAVWGVLQQPGVGRTIVRIDPVSYEIEPVVDGLPILPNPVAPVTHNGSIWLVSWDKSSVTQYDAETSELIREIDVGLHPIEPVVAYGDVWAINHEGDSLTRIDAETGEAYAAIDIPDSVPLAITPIDDELMIVTGPSQTHYLVNPDTMEMTGSYEPAECFANGAMVGEEYWVKICERDEIAIVDPATGDVLDSFEARALPATPLVVDGNVWMPFGAENGPGIFGLVGLDPQTHAVVGEYEQQANIREGSAFTAFGSWWRWGWDGLLRIPAETLRDAVQ
jgi:hypothetical protein